MNPSKLRFYPELNSKQPDPPLRKNLRTKTASAMADFDDEDWGNEVENIDPHRQNVDLSPDAEQLLGPWTVIALMLNRTIGMPLNLPTQNTFFDS
jgi:hypothetical protein